LLLTYFFRKESLKTITFNLSVYLLIFILIYGGFLLFRFIYFKDIFPNTYYAKGGPKLSDLINILLLKPEIFNKVYELFNSAIYPWASVFFGGLIIVTAYLVYIKDFTKQHLILLLMLTFSGLIYILLPRDWMAEYRFATIFFPFFYTYLFIVSKKTIEKLRWQNSRKFLLAVILIIIFIGPSIVDFAKRTYQFRNKPTVPFLKVVKIYSATFDNYAKMLNVKNGSFLLPDIGGTLYYSKLRIYDLGGLTDKTIAITLGKKQKEFYDHVFDKLKPTFIHTHGGWTYLANFDLDKRFREDYLPIRERIEPYSMQEYGISVIMRPDAGEKFYSGDYMRKDVLNGNSEILKQIIQLAEVSK